MLFVKERLTAPIAEVSSALSERSRIEIDTNDTNRGRPRIHFRNDDGRVKISCEMVGGAKRDNGFLEGTYFRGRLVERNGITSLRGIIVTAPIYHTILLMLFAFFIVQCIRVGGFSPVPVILLIFDIFMFKDEFKKQGIIKQYIFRSFKDAYTKLNKTN